MRLNRNSIPPLLQTKQLSSIDGMRGISILLVVMNHFFFAEHKNVFLRVFSGLFAVHVFFVISGFLITILLLKESVITGNISLKKFYLRRFLRIFPVAYLFLIVLFGIDFFFKLSIPLNGYLSSALYIRNTSIFPSSDWYTGHFWSLSVEEQFYIFSPFLLRKSLLLFIGVAILLIIGIPVLEYKQFHGGFTNQYWMLLYELSHNLTGILIGSLFAILYFYGIIQNLISKHEQKNFIIPLFFVLAAIVDSNFIRIIPNAITPLLSSVLIAFVLIMGLKPSSDIVFKFLNSKPLMKLGLLSYSVYIWQQLFTHLQPWRFVINYGDSKLINLIVLLLVSFCSYYFYERRFLDLKKRFEIKN